MSAPCITNDTAEEEAKPRCCFLPELLKNPERADGFEPSVNPEVVVATLREMMKLMKDIRFSCWKVTAMFADSKILREKKGDDYAAPTDLTDLEAPRVHDIAAVLVFAFCIANAMYQPWSQLDKPTHAAIINLAVAIYKPEMDTFMRFVQSFSVDYSREWFRPAMESNFCEAVDAESLQSLHDKLIERASTFSSNFDVARCMGEWPCVKITEFKVDFEGFELEEGLDDEEEEKKEEVEEEEEEEEDEEEEDDLKEAQKLQRRRHPHGRFCSGSIICLHCARVKRCLAAAAESAVKDAVKGENESEQQARCAAFT